MLRDGYFISRVAEFFRCEGPRQHGLCRARSFFRGDLNSAAYHTRGTNILSSRSLAALLVLWRHSPNREAANVLRDGICLSGRRALSHFFSHCNISLASGRAAAESMDSYRMFCCGGYFLLKLLFGGLRGSRTITVFGLFWIAGAIHIWIRPVPRKFLA